MAIGAIFGDVHHDLGGGEGATIGHDFLFNEKLGSDSVLLSIH
jgi:hypothetical protein